MRASRALLWWDRVLRMLGWRAPLALVVDQHEEVARLVARVLRRNGFRVFLAFDALDGLSKAVDLQPDVLVLDGMLPGLDGFRLVRILREVLKLERAKVILSTALVHAEEEALAAGADAFLLKPCAVQDIAATARRLLRREPF